jgi:DNA-binding SARP family transcriptional activator
MVIVHSVAQWEDVDRDPSRRESGEPDIGARHPERRMMQREDDDVPVSHELLTDLLRGLDAAVGGDAWVARTLGAAREAAELWERRREELARSERARRRAAAVERAARDQMTLILALGVQLAARPAGQQPQAPAESPAVRDRPRLPATGLAVRTLGGFEVRIDGRPVTAWRGRRGPAVLQLLVAGRAAGVEREALTELLWPEVGADLGRHRTHQAVYTLRQTLQQVDPGREHVVCEAGAYRLSPELPVWSDAAEFERLVVLGQRHEPADRDAEAFDAYRAADDLYRGDLVAAPAPADWAATERHRLQAMYVLAGDRLSHHLAERGDHAAALRVCTKVLERDRWHEEVTRRAMRCYAATGSPSLALRLYRAFEVELAEELGVVPSAQTRRLYRELCPTASAGHSPR